jgi:hypothetical protein
MAWDIIYYPYFDGAYWQYLLFLNYNPIAAAGLGIVIGLCKTAYAETLHHLQHQQCDIK